MQKARIPKATLGTEIRAGRISLFRMAGKAASGRLGGVIDAVAEAGLRAAGGAAVEGAGLEWPEGCCKCMSRGKSVQPVESSSVVNRGVAYVFRFPLPHCPACAGTANQKRPGDLGTLAMFLVVSAVATIGILILGLALESDAIIFGSFVAGPLVGILLPWAWAAIRPGRERRGSRYQAVYASALDLSTGGEPTSFELSFENDAYAARFVALNRPRGVIAG